MNKIDIAMFNELSRKICNELKPKDKCMSCPFYQWDTYYNCFDENGFNYPINEGDDLNNDSN